MAGEALLAIREKDFMQDKPLFRKIAQGEEMCLLRIDDEIEVITFRDLEIKKRLELAKSPNALSEAFLPRSKEDFKNMFCEMFAREILDRGKTCILVFVDQLVLDVKRAIENLIEPIQAKEEAGNA
jgi:hypothetical protein